MVFFLVSLNKRTVFEATSGRGLQLNEVQAVTRIFILFTKALFEAQQCEADSHATKMKRKDQEPRACVVGGYRVGERMKL